MIDYVLKDRVGRLPQAVLHDIKIASMRIKLRTKRDDLALARSHLEKLTIQLIDAQEQERMSLARELHDELGQRLAVLKINLHRLRSFLNGQDALDVWTYADTEVVLLITQIRAISVSLRPPALDSLGLESAIRQLLERQFVNTGISCIFEYAGLPARLDPSIEITVYRIIQESITNIVRHANATRVVVEINGGETGDELELILRDNGSGFDAGTNMTAQPGGAGSGLLGMRERVELLGGIFNVETSKWQGTCVVASLLLKNKSIKDETD